MSLREQGWTKLERTQVGCFGRFVFSSPLLGSHATARNRTPAM
jgi:hypothetical protein